MDQSTMRFLFGDRELVLTTGPIQSAQTDVILIPASPGLQPLDDPARQITEQGGERVQQEKAQLIREYGEIDYGMAVFTSAGNLPYQAIIHAVVPDTGTQDPRRLLEQALSRSLQLCDLNEWRALACPVMDLSAADLGIEDLAQAYFRVITHFWDARQECSLEKVMIYASPAQFRPFFDAFREQGFTDEATPASKLPATGTADEQVGEIELSEDDLAAQDNSDIDNWFK